MPQFSISSASSSAGGILAAVAGAQAQAHAAREATRLGAGTRSQEMAAIVHAGRMANEAVKQQAQIKKQVEIQQADLRREQSITQAAMAKQLERERRAQEDAANLLARQQAEITAMAPMGFRMPIWGWAGIGAGALGMTALAILILKRS